jgi:hypothetical protein
VAFSGRVQSSLQRLRGEGGGGGGLFICVTTLGGARIPTKSYVITSQMFQNTKTKVKRYIVRFEWLRPSVTLFYMNGFVQEHVHFQIIIPTAWDHIA